MAAAHPELSKTDPADSSRADRDLSLSLSLSLSGGARFYERRSFPVSTDRFEGMTLLRLGFFYLKLDHDRCFEEGSTHSRAQGCSALEATLSRGDLWS